jgi:hypothetical protein
MIHWLEEWYYSNCDNDWEHTYGISIGTLDNPGWTVEIDLKGTPLENLDFDAVDIERTMNNWIVCSVANNQFVAQGGPQNLSEILDIFHAIVNG